MIRALLLLPLLLVFACEQGVQRSVDDADDRHVIAFTHKSSTPVKPQLQDHSASDRARIKAGAMAGTATAGQFVAVTYGSYLIELGQAQEISGGIEVLARAWKSGLAVGFGDGTVEWERFRVYNPPIMVPDGTKRSVTDARGFTYQVDNFKEDALEALRQVIAHNVHLVGRPGSAIILGKVGSTTSTFYPDADPETTTVDSYVGIGAQASWAAAHDATTGNAVNDAATDFWTSVTTGYAIYRLFFLFDTASIPDADTVTEVTLSLYAKAPITNNDNDGNDFVSIATTTPASNTAMVNADFDQIGTTEMHDSGQRKDFGGISTTAYTDWTLNATGRDQVSKTGITKFGAREGHDLLNDAATATNDINWSPADTSGTTQDPKLVVVHAVQQAAVSTAVAPLLIGSD